MFKFYNQLRLARRMMLGFGLVFVIALAVVTWVGIMNMNRLIGQAEQRELNAHYTAIQNALIAEGRLAVALSTLVASSPAAQTAMANDDRSGLLAQFEQAYAILRKDFGAEQFQFHTPPAFSYLRVHQPQKFGDDLAAFRKTVVETNARQAPITGLERGVAGIGIRGVVPMYHQGRHLGSVEFGMTFGQLFFDEFKQRHHVEVALHLPADGSYKPFASTLGNQPLLPNDVLDLALQGAPQSQYRQVNDTSYALLAAPIKDYSGNPVGVLEIAVNRSEYLSTSGMARNLTILAGIVTLGLGLIMAWRLAHSIVHPLRRVITELGRIADGDLAVQIQTPDQSEIGQLNEGLRAMVEKMRELLVRIKQAADDLDHAADGVARVAEQSRDGMARQQHETEQVVTAMSQISATVDDVAQNAAGGAEAAQQADLQASMGANVVSETIAIINDAAAEVKRASEAVSHLKAQSESIGSVVEVIKGIADQTNLLALNAAIEAARAGEQGRGFAVVADEVRTLASRTTESTAEIHRIVEQLQSGAASAEMAMQKGNDKTRQGVEKAHAAGSSLQQITAAITHIADRSTQIAGAAEEQAAVVREINNNIGNISAVSRQTNQGAQQTAAASEQLGGLVDQLKLQLGRFKLGAG